MMLRSLTLITTVLILFAGCQKPAEKPADLIEEELYLDVMTDLFFHERMINMRNAGDLADSLESVLYQHYEITPEQFRTSHDYYQRQTSRQLERIDRIEEIMRSERDTLEQIRREIREAEREQLGREEAERQLTAGEDD